MMEKSSRCRKLRSTMVECTLQTCRRHQLPLQLSVGLRYQFDQTFLKTIGTKKQSKKTLLFAALEQRHCEHEHCWRRRRHQRRRRRRRRRKILRKKRDDITQKMEEYCAMILRNRYYARCKKYCASIRKKGSVSRYYAGILRKHKTHQRSKQTFWCNQKYIGHGTSKINNSVLDLSTDNTMFWANYFWIFQC